MLRSWTLLVDTREKAPLLFPEYLTTLDADRLPHPTASTRIRVHTVKRRLDVGDYALASDPRGTILERKGRVEEVAANCLTKDRKRFVSCLERLRDACEYPILLLEGSPLSLSRASSHVAEPGLAVDALLRLLAEHRIEFLLLPTSSVAQRRATGDLVARLLIARALHATSPVQPGR